MDQIKKSNLKPEYFKSHLWGVANLTGGEIEELDILANHRGEVLNVSARAYSILKSAFAKLDRAIDLKYDKISITKVVGHEGYFLKDDVTGELLSDGRLHTDNKVPGK